MKIRTTRGAIVTTLAAAGWAVCAACSGNSAAPGQSGTGHPADDAGGDGGSGTSSGGSSGGGSSGGGTDGSTSPSDGSTVSDGGGGGDGPVTPPTDAAMDDPTCSPNTQYGSPSAVPGVPAFGTQPLVTMTNDELTLAWVVDNGGGEGTVFVADRTSATAAFGAAIQLPPSSTASSFFSGDATVVDAGDSYFAFDRVALSADGLKLVGIGVGNHAIAQFTRVMRSGAFTATPAEGPFGTLVQTLMPGEMLGDPVLGSNGSDLVYSKYGLSPTLSVYETFLNGQTWPSGAGQTATALAEASGHRKRPTSMTADRRTLFVWDEAGQAYGILRETDTSQFNFAISFGTRFSIQVNGDCTHLYYVAASGSGYALEEVSAM
jgi:hypothetical protein